MFETQLRVKNSGAGSIMLKFIIRISIFSLVSGLALHGIRYLVPSFEIITSVLSFLRF